MADTVLNFKDGFDFVRLLDKIPQDLKRTWEEILKCGPLENEQERELLSKLNWVIGWGMDNFQFMDHLQFKAFKAAWHQLVDEIDEFISEGKSIPLSHYTAQAFGKGVWWQKGHDDAVNWTDERIKRFLRPAKRARPSNRSGTSLLCLAEYKAGAHVQIQSVLTTEESNQITEWTEAAKNLVKDVSWSKLEDSDLRFPWLDKLRESNDILLARLGMMYEYAREATKLKHLFALLETKDQFSSLSTIRAEFDGLDEPTAEKALRVFYSSLRKLRHFLIDNYSFDELFGSFNDDLNAALGRSHDSKNIADEFDSENVSHCLVRSAVSLRYDGDRANATTVEDYLGGEKRERKWVQDDKGAAAEDLVLRIDWRDYRNQELTKAFETFINYHRPKDLFPEPKAQTGRGHNEFKRIATALNQLAALRIINKYSQDAVRELIDSGSVKFTNNYKAYEAAKKARELFKVLYPFEAQAVHDLTYSKSKT